MLVCTIDPQPVKSVWKSSKISIEKLKNSIKLSVYHSDSMCCGDFNIEYAGYLLGRK